MSADPRAAIDARDHRAIENIARCDPDALTGLHAKMLDAGLLRPALAYRTADAATRDRLIERLRGFDGSSPRRGSAETLTLDAHLTALAWIGDSAARDAFRAFRETRPTWADALYLAPDAYTITAGWVLQPNGSRRDLFLAEGRALVRATEPSGPVRVLGLTDGQCRFCENPLGTLFEMDLRAPELAFLSLRGEAFPIPFCHLCSCYGTLAFRVDANGRAEWHESNERFPVYHDTFSPWTEPLVLGRPLTNPFEFAGFDVECASGECLAQGGPSVVCGTICDGGGPGVAMPDLDLEPLGGVLTVAACDLLLGCCHADELMTLGYPPLTKSACRRIVPLFANSLLSMHNLEVMGRLVVDGPGLAMCYAEYAQQSCMDYSHNPLLDCSAPVTGLVPDSDPCIYDIECATGHCYQPNPALAGTCTPMPGSGETCSWPGPCAAALYCEGATCEMQKPLGDACDEHAECADGWCSAQTCALACDGV